MLNFALNDRISDDASLTESETFYNPGTTSGISLPVNPVTLAFEGVESGLEDEYKERFFVRYLPLIRASHWLAIVFYAAFGLLDIYLFPEKTVAFLVIRLGVVCPLFAIGIVLTYMPWYRRVCPFMLMFFVLLTAGGYTAMSAMVPMIHSFGYYVGVVVCLIFGYTFIRLPFLHASAAGWLVLLMYWMFGTGVADPPKSVLMNQLAYLFGLNVLLMIICYTVERADRHNFYLSHLLAVEKDKVSKINEGLEETVQRRTIDLESANWQLSREIEAHKAAQSAKEQLARQLRQAQKMEAMGTLAGGIAHDFNNILGSIMGFTELAIDDAEQNSMQHNNLEEVMVAGKRARDLVKQILAFSRQGDQDTQPIGLTKIIGEVRNLLRATLPTSIEIDVQIEAQPTIMGDPTQLTQVVMNLGINASQAMESKGGILTIRLERTTLDQAFCDQHPGTSPGLYALMLIEDTGEGIAPEILERIFDPFFTTKPQGQGTGLGLSVVHGIVKNHGGAITVASRIGQGTTFRIYLPVFENAAPRETPTEVYLPKGRETILYVDDERALLNFGQQTLSRLGYHVTTRDNALEALELFKAQHERIHMVITDLSMPYLSGDAFIAALKKIRPEMPTILCSGLDNRVSREKLEQLGVDAVINKPVLKADLAQTVRRVFDQRSTENQREADQTDSGLWIKPAADEQQEQIP